MQELGVGGLGLGPRLTLWGWLWVRHLKKTRVRAGRQKNVVLQDSRAILAHCPSTWP
jgi:hypothetical protein